MRISDWSSDVCSSDLRVAELRLEQVMARHRGEPGVDLPDFTCADPVDRSLHVVEDPALRHTAQYAERLGQRIEQHLVRLQRIGPDDERLAVRQLGMCGLPLQERKSVVWGKSWSVRLD